MIDNIRRTAVRCLTGILVVSAACCMPPLAYGQADAGKKHFAKGEYAKAIEAFKPVLEKTPKDANANYYTGASYYRLGNNKAAVKPLELALERGVPDAAIPLVEMSLLDYRIDDVDDYMTKAETALDESKSRNKDVETRLGELKSRAMLMRNMLERVEQIEIVDSVRVDANDFIRFYKLSKEAGRIIDGSTMPLLSDLASPAIVYRNANDTELFWAIASPDGKGTDITSASILGDGTIDANVDVTSGMENLGKGSRSNFPFLMPDGVTLYFANDGKESVGGYDIFMTRRGSDGTFLQPQNVGMPYNSPYNDYMLAIDEENGVGWWATDRNAPDGKVTIYTYIYNGDTRTNVTGDMKTTADAARISSIAATQKPGTNYAAIIDKIEKSHAESDDTPNDAPVFRFSMGNGKVYRCLEDFRRADASRLMLQLLDQKQQLERKQAYLAQLRVQYANGNKSVGKKILDLERQLLQAPEEIKRLSNQVIQAELQKR